MFWGSPESGKGGPACAALFDIVDWVPTVTLRYEELVSKRLRGYQFHPVWGFLADQAWVADD